jgi:hypothetical protein
MHSYGLLPASFLPPAPFARLRPLWRHRERLIAEQGRCLQQMQDAMELMNIQLHKVLSDVAGVTGLLIIRAIVAGERDPKRLARFRDPRVKCSAQELCNALTGDYQAEEIFILGQRLARYDFIQEQLAALDAQIEQRLALLQETCPPPTPVPTDPAVTPPAPAEPASPAAGSLNVAPPTAKRKSRSKQEPTLYDWHLRIVALCGVDPTRIRGLAVLTVLALISELGTDLSAWASAKQFTAWLGLAPDHRVTGGKVIKRQTRRGKPHAAHAFYLAALAVSKSHSPLGEFYRYQKARMGPRKALTATARKIAILYYHLLKYGPVFVETGQRRMEANSAARKRRKLNRLAAEFGVGIVEKPRAA